MLEQEVTTVALKNDKGELERRQACITSAMSVSGYELLTVEGLADENGEPSPLQKAFLEHFSFQCGYSSPGFLLGATLLMDKLKRQPIPVADVEKAIHDELGQHICRCTGYVRYYQAIKEVILKTPGLTVS